MTDPSGADGTQLYALQIVDKAGGYGELEGAWRDVRRPGTVGSTGLIDDLRPLHFVLRLTLQAAAAAWMVLGAIGLLCFWFLEEDGLRLFSMALRP